MNTTALVKVAKSPAGALLIGFLSREIAAAAGFTFKAVIKGAIRHSVVAQRAIKNVLDEVKADIKTLADEAIHEANLAEEHIPTEHDVAPATASAPAKSAT